MDQRANFLALILLDALEDENECDVNNILEKNSVDASYVPLERGLSPLHYVCGMENVELGIKVANRFLKNGANPNVRSEENMTPLHVAAIHGRLEVVKLLLENGASIDVRDDDRKTPVHYAIEQCHFEVFQAMRDHIFIGKYKKKRQNGELSTAKTNTQSQKESQNENIQYTSTPNQPEPDNDSETAVCVNKNLLTASDCMDNSKYTPNRVHYNFDTTSPYYINITHRRHKPQPLFPGLDSTQSPGQQATMDSVHQMNPQEPANSTQIVADSRPVNIFSLTKENLEELSHILPPAESSRLSLIEIWREKVQRSRERKSILKEFNSVDEMVDGVMGNDHLNFGNTVLRQNSTDTEKDSGACGSTASSQTEEKAIKRISSKQAVISLGAVIQKIAQAHLVNPEPDKQDLESSYQTAPDVVVGAAKDAKTVADTSKLQKAEDPNTSNFIRSPKSNDYFLQLTEAYVHTDDENGLVFYETKYLANHGNKVAQQRTAAADGDKNTLQVPANPLETTVTTQSTNITIPLDYETDELRAELTTFGEPPGPITKSTKRLYIKRLIKYKRKAPQLLESQQRNPDKAINKFSVELYRTVRSLDIFNRIVDYLDYEAQSATYFANHQHKHNVREGHLKQSFIYMLIDPRISCNLPGESVFLEKFDIWKRFLQSIFYVGKGKTSRPYSHLYEAMKVHSRAHHQQVDATDGKKVSIRKQPLNVELFKSPPTQRSHSKKLDRILEIWGNGNGVVCLHVFHNILPIEAYTREAAMIDALSLQHLTNVKRGDYYGVAKTWTMKEKKYLGIALLLRAMQIYLAEGESQLSPSDLI